MNLSSTSERSRSHTHSKVIVGRILIALIPLLLFCIQNSFSQAPSIGFTIPHYLPGNYNVSCYGGNDGYIHITASGGTPPYTYECTWGTNSSTSQNIGSLGAGSYQIFVYDNNGMAASTVVDLVSPSASPFVSLTKHDADCFGSSTGSIHPLVSTGAAPYTYEWTGTGGFTSALDDIDLLPAGTYTLVIHDALGCSANAHETINEPAQMVVTITPTVYGSGTPFQVHCNHADGSVSASVTGGTSPSNYSYNWSNGLSSQSISGLTSGTYSVTVTDANVTGCHVNSGSVTLNEQTPCLNPILANTHLSSFPGGYNISCNGASDGSITVQSVTGGDGQYTFEWTGPGIVNPITTQNISGVIAGTYHLHIADGGTGYNDFDIELTEPNPVNIIPSVTEITCHGTNNGELSATVSGGVPSYTYAWTALNSNTFGTVGSQTITQLLADHYYLTVTDVNGCHANFDQVLTEPQDMVIHLTPSIIGAFNVSCAIGNDGYINTDIDEGTPPYKYEWSNFESTASISQLSAEKYVLTVYDAHGCKQTQAIILTQEVPCVHPATSWQTNGNAITNANVNFLGTTDNAYLAFRTSNIENMRISEFGHVGIGTALPQKALHVYTKHISSGVEVGRDIPSEQQIMSRSFIPDPADPVKIIRQPKFDMQGNAISTGPGFNVVSGTGVQLLPSNVDFSNGISQGIRLEDYEASQYIVGSNTIGVVGTGGNSGQSMNIAYATSKWDIEPLVTNKGTAYLGLSHLTANSATRIMVLTDDGRVGINTETPVADLQVNPERSLTMGSIAGTGDLNNGEYLGFNSTLVVGGGGVTQMLKLGSASAPQTGGAVISADKTGNLNFMAYDAGMPAQMLTAYKPQLTLTKDGDMTLKANSGNADFVIESGGGIKYDLAVIDDGSFRVDKMGTGGGTRISIAPSGSIGIGTNDPQALLDVRGKIKMCAGEVQVVAGCDFVFGSEYELGSITDREKYLIRNKHLPNIQSAKVMEENGVDISTTMMGMLRNIEELNLYVIELNKKIEELEKENKNLKK